MALNLVPAVCWLCAGNHTGWMSTCAQLPTGALRLGTGALCDEAGHSAVCAFPSIAIAGERGDLEKFCRQWRCKWLPHSHADALCRWRVCRAVTGLWSLATGNGSVK
jgi:hypothetical protein